MEFYGDVSLALAHFQGQAQRCLKLEQLEGPSGARELTSVDKY